MTWLWGLLAAGAVLWPDHISGPFDGIPLDRVAEAVLIGGVFPALCIRPGLLKTTRPRRRRAAGGVANRVGAVIRAGRMVREIRAARPLARDETVRRTPGTCAPTGARPTRRAPRS